MRLSVERRGARSPEVHVLEVVTPRTNLASLTSAENLLGAVSLPEPFALEIAADDQARRFMVRSQSEGMRQHLAGQLGAAYPQAALRTIAAGHDPAARGPEEQVHCCALELRKPPYLPIRTFEDGDLDPERAPQADPVLGILGALGDLPPGWRALSQLVLAPAPDRWSTGFERLAVQHPLAAERVPRPSDTSLPSLVLLAVLLGCLAAGVQGLDWYQHGNWPGLLGLAGVPIALGLGALGLRRLFRPPLYDMELVRDKVSRVAFRCEVRLSLYAPRDVAADLVRARLERFAAAYRHYNLAAGNGFRARSLGAGQILLDRPRPVGRRWRCCTLTTRELAGLWHLPHAAADVALLERTTARRWLPLPGSVAGGCRIGVSLHQGKHVPVEVPEDVLRRHLLLVAKTRRGKSTLLLRLAEHALQAERRRGVVLVDPHQDLAEAVLARVPVTRWADVVYVNLADQARPVGLNVLDVGLGWPRDRAVANALTVFQREWSDRNWGPRMEDVFRFALLTLYEANAAFCAADPEHGRARQYTLLDLSTLLRVDSFRRSVLVQVGDPLIHRWWATYYDSLERRFQTEVMNPVLTKVHRFEGNSAARLIVGQPASTIDPLAWLRDGAVVVINTARGTLGENAAALLGSTLLNLVALAVAEQAALAEDARCAISMFVDEFHTLPGVDYEGILSELSKYGANLVLATQSLARLKNSGIDRALDLRALVFANLDGLFAFNCSAEDAEYLVPELGGALDVQDLVELGEHQCYARLSTRGERLPTFSVNLDAPRAGDPCVRDALAAESARRYGRAAGDVERALHLALARGSSALVGPIDAAVAKTDADAEPNRARNDKRVRKKRRPPEVIAYG